MLGRRDLSIMGLRVSTWTQQGAVPFFSRLCCSTSTETVGLLGTGAQDGHLDFHTAPELCHFRFFSANTCAHSPGSVASNCFTHSPGSVKSSCFTHSPGSVASSCFTHSPGSVESSCFTHSPGSVESNCFTHSPGSVESSCFARCRNTQCAAGAVSTFP